MLNLQVFILTLVPLLFGAVPSDGKMPIGALSLLGIGDRPSAEFLVGTWKYSDEFFRWGITDKDKAEVRPFRGRAYMTLRQDGSAKMVNLFKPANAQWKLNEQGIVLYDPQHPERFSQTLPVRKRDQDRIWILLPFTGGATGIGLVRVPEDEPSKAEPRPKSSQRRHREADEETKEPFDW